MKKAIFTILVIFSFAGVFAQEVEFTADRPGASTGPSTVAKGVIQWEQGVQYDGDGGKGALTFSSTLFRYGLFDGMELRLSGDGFIYNNGSKWKPAFSGVSIGTKISCFEGNGAVPAVSVLADFSIPATGTKGFVVENMAPSLYLLFENPLNDKLSLGYNVGAEWDGLSPSPLAFVALCLGCSVTDDLGCFVESYNYFGKAGNQFCADLGFNYMVARKVQLDVAANLDLCNPANCWAVSFGVAWQINK
jgi:hypothetical protein